MKAPSRLPSPVSPAASLTELRRAITDLSSRGAQDVDAVRRAFTAGIPPLQTVSSGSVSDYITRFGGSGVASQVAKSTVQLGVSTAVVGTIVTPPKPELDFIEVGDDRSFGVLDSFYTHLVASLSADDAAKVAYLRILRAPTGRARGASKPSFSAMIDAMPIGAKTKSVEYISNTAFRANDVGVGNMLTSFVTDDPFTKQRAVVNSGTLRPLPPPVNTNRRGTDSALLAIGNADRSVLENVRFYVNQRTMSPVQQVVQPLVLAQQQGINVLKGSTVGGKSAVVEANNAAGFYEVARLPVSNARTVGAFVEVDFYDPSVVYGASYTYYVVAVTRDGTEGPRSRLVKVDISRFRPPATPDVLYGVVAGRPRFSVRCSGTFLDHVEVFRRGAVVPESVRVLSTREALLDDSAPVGTDSGFFHVGDLGLGVDRSAVYVDRNVANGQSLDYRFYAVDAFGAKSATPFSCSVVLPDHGHHIPLALPSITAEQAPGGRVVSVSVRCDDPRVSAFVVGRRELTSGERSYRQPTVADRFTLGATTPLRADSRVGPALNQFSKKAWNGVMLAVSGAASFNDLSVQFDRRYQYAVQAIDVRGNRTSMVPCPPVFVAVKPVSDAPLALTGTVLVDSNGVAPVGVRVEWSAGTLDFSPNDLVGDQDVLAATAQRSVYQVERRLVGMSAWEAMPATTATHFVDPVSTAEAPKFRPSYARANMEYDYRVISMQSGAFVSTHTEPVRVIVAPEIVPPVNVWLRSTPTSLRPIHVAVSWQYDGRFVDGWEIERAVTNKIYGSKIFSMDSPEARALNYQPVARVTRESSRGHGVSVDPTLDPAIFVGNRFYVDQDIDLANSYFYRVRAFDAAGRLSGWTYAGIALTDSPHDRKFLSALSDDEKAALTLDSRPVTKWRNG